MTTVATWNLHHMGKEAKIPAEVVEVIERVKPDIVVLTEYVDRGGRTDFLSAVERIGYRKPRCSMVGREPRQNQVLLASVEEQEEGRCAAPDVDEAARTNFLHGRVPTCDLDVIGFRVPHYQSEKPPSPAKLESYWRQLTTMAFGIVGQRLVLIGDFNIGSKAIDEPGRAALKTLVKAGYRMCAEEGGLDRALVSPSLKLKSFAVIEAAAGHRLTGQGGLSDHPMLVVDIE